MKIFPILPGISILWLLSHRSGFPAFLRKPCPLCISPPAPQLVSFPMLMTRLLFFALLGPTGFTMLGRPPGFMLLTLLFPSNSSGPASGILVLPLLPICLANLRTWSHSRHFHGLIPEVVVGPHQMWRLSASYALQVAQSEAIGS